MAANSYGPTCCIGNPQGIAAYGGYLFVADAGDHLYSACLQVFRVSDGKLLQKPWMPIKSKYGLQTLCVTNGHLYLNLGGPRNGTSHPLVSFSIVKP